MKKIIAAFVGLTILCGCVHEETYCGKVTEKYLLHKNNGGTHNVIFYCDTLHKFVNVSVTSDCYVNTKEGEVVCFKLRDYEVGK